MSSLLLKVLLYSFSSSILKKLVLPLASEAECVSKPTKTIYLLDNAQ